MNFAYIYQYTNKDNETRRLVVVSGSMVEIANKYAEHYTKSLVILIDRLPIEEGLIIPDSWMDTEYRYAIGE